MLHHRGAWPFNSSGALLELFALDARVSDQPPAARIRHPLRPAPARSAADAFSDGVTRGLAIVPDDEPPPSALRETVTRYVRLAEAESKPATNLSAGSEADGGAKPSKVTAGNPAFRREVEPLRDLIVEALEAVPNLGRDGLPPAPLLAT